MARADQPASATLAVRVTPRAARSELRFVGEHLRARVTAPPVEGEATRALVELLARALGLPRSSVEVISGERGRQKTVRITGLGLEEVRRRLAERRS